MKEILGALLAANIIGFAILAYVLHDHNDEYHDGRRRINVEVNGPDRYRPHRNESRPYYDSPYYRQSENHYRSPNCPSHFRYERADIYVDIHSGHYHQYIGSNTYINLSTGQRFCPH